MPFFYFQLLTFGNRALKPQPLHGHVKKAVFVSNYWGSGYYA